MAVFETRLDETLKALPAAMESAIFRAMTEGPLALRVLALENARERGRENSGQQVHEWLRSVLPYVLAGVAYAVAKMNG